MASVSDRLTSLSLCDAGFSYNARTAGAYASKNDVRRKSHPTKAVAVCTEALKRPPWKVHRSKVAPDVVVSDRSTSVKVHSTKRAAPRSSPYQSSPRKCLPVATWASVTAPTVVVPRERAGRIGSSP